MVGRATLHDDDEVASIFFLCARIFSRAAAATKPAAQPSGCVPVSPLAAGVFSKPDHVCKVLFRVLVVIVRGLFVFSFFLLGLSINLYPPLE
jgi:hypothetical protein